MKNYFLAGSLFTSLLFLCNASGSAQQTAIDRYVKAADHSFEWKIVSSTPGEGTRLVVLDMISQTWRAPDEVNRTKWQHWVKVVIPDKVRSDIGFMLVGGGSNGKAPPQTVEARLVKLAQLTGTVVAELEMVPNQPLIFHNDGEKRVEDNLIGYTWNQYIQTGDPQWLARGPMTKSVVRAMDAVTALMSSEDGGGYVVDKFVVAGGSKRGWTTWITAAVDARVVAIMPIVIDVLNTRESMKHHFAAYGFWAPSIGDYVRHRIMPRMDNPVFDEINALVDPFSYRQRFTMPKLVLNAVGDQFFLPDSSQFYWQDLPGPKSLRYIPNTDHGMRGTDVFESMTAFYWMVIHGRSAPELTWSIENDGQMVVRVSEAPTQVLLWQATNPLARDFRKETFGARFDSRELSANADGTYSAKVATPAEGWTASLIEATFDVGAPTPLKLTTSVQVTPDTLPFRDKDPKQEASLTVTGVAQSEQVATEVVTTIEQLVSSGTISAPQLSSVQVGSRFYFNWRPPLAEFRQAALQMTKLLTDKGCQHIAYQLESGLGATVAPGLSSQTATK